MVLIQCRSGGGRQGNAFIGWAEEHEVFSFGLCQYRGIKTPESGQHVACVEEAGVQEIRADPARFKGKLAKAEDATVNGERKKIVLRVGHRQSGSVKP